MLQNIPHQIVQSPARLGLPTPSSPSLQNPKLPTQTPQASSLLSLLPPLPRAQSLLLQMASLASRLFQVSPNRSHWLSSFRGSLPSFLSSSSSSSLSQPDSAKEILSQFTSPQTQFFESVAELQEILDLQDAKNKLSREINSLDSSLLDFATKVKNAEHALDTLVDDYSSEYRKSSSTTMETTLKLSEILSYAHKISYTTFAPPEFGSGQGLLRGALPPAPQEEQIRASQLYSFAGLDVGLPKADDERMIIEPMVEEPESGAIPIPNIVIPSGWRPGMPVELPSDLPMVPPPPGWKPGDPVPMPPLDLLPPVGRGPLEEEAVRQPRPVVPPVGPIGRGPEPIQVRHVQLDIEDDSSDYSSDEGSSDSED
ncbi:Mediator of RNA polymerase II transcription subunit 4 [Striga hermonthica]|uniref:Mediator of RNA polymerase II transcription subunit 4 n=1 Tax=Striga hermonthica TaxID=68872 RepID=A0A9N7N2W1_STRHE|nr:Mediator of RNA polymerase II transcription subunit 4 [Striga hermonthica]